MKLFSNKTVSIAVITLFLAAILYSCQKDQSEVSNTTEEELIASTQESAEAEASFDDAGEIAFLAAEEESSASLEGGRLFPIFVELRATIGDCATITVTPNDSTYPKTITIDFGTGCVGREGKTRKGKIVIHLTAPLRRPGAVATITFVEYYVNRVHLEGTKILSNLSTENHFKFSVQVVDGKVTWPSGRGFAYAGIKVKTQIGGMNTNNIRDNVYKIEGRSKTEFHGGLTIVLNTEDPLIKKVVCPWISEGTLKIKINDRVFKLDYGFPNNGNCDNKALLTWNNGNDQRIVLLP